MEQIENQEIIKQNIQTLSKKQQKKLAKKEKQKEYFKEKKIQKKQIKKQQKQIIQQQNGQEKQQNEQEKQQNEEQQIQNEEQQIQKEDKQIKRTKDQYKEEMQNSIKVIIDLQFLNEMTIQEKTSLYKQIELCHSINYKSQKPLNIIVTSLTEDFKQLLNKSNAQNWGIQLEEKAYIDNYPNENLVYLTGDTDTTIKELNKDEIYIIGGLVDHNRLKLITYNKAQEQQIKTRRLPINVNLKTSCILTVNQVFEILLRVNNGENWDESVQNAIPKRKLA